MLDRFWGRLETEKKKKRKRLGKWNRVRTIPTQVKRGKRMENKEMTKELYEVWWEDCTFR